MRYCSAEIASIDASFAVAASCRNRDRAQGVWQACPWGAQVAGQQPRVAQCVTSAVDAMTPCFNWGHLAALIHVIEWMPKVTHNSSEDRMIDD
jgi:hypothetical protein